MTKDEALKMALEALKIGYDYAADETERFHIEMAGYKPKRHEAMDADVSQIDDAITAVKEVQAQPEEQTSCSEQEPVAWMMTNPKHVGLSKSLHWEPQNWHITWEAVPLYTSPQARPWVGLTDEEIESIFSSCSVWDKFKYERMLEVKLKEKNT